jgi:S-DNA-T family DNA segregation ATPase FtsK/SpoIIIE
VLGATGSGTTTALDTLGVAAAASGRAVVRVPAAPADAWAVLANARDRPVAGRVLLIDDLDSLLGRLDEDYRHAAVDLVAGLLRGSPVGADALVVSARRLTGSLAGLAGSFGSRLLLRQGSREDHLLAGGDPGRFEPDAPAGSGTWRGVDVQVAVAPPGDRAKPQPPSLPAVRPGDHAVLAVVATRPAPLLAALREAGCRVVDLSRGGPPAPDDLLVARGTVPTVLVGDPDAWQAEWALLTAARRQWPLVLAGCTPADHRILLRDRELPPPLGDRPGECWLASGGATVRAVFDPVSTLESEEKQP